MRRTEMKKACFFLTILLLCSALSASTTDVFRSTTEVSAYKKLVPTDTLVEDDDLPIPEAVTSFKIMASDNSEVGVGNSSYSGTITSGNYNQQITNVFKWEMTGNVYSNISVSFEFWPLYEGRLDIAGSMTVSDYTTVIPYTVTMYNSATSVYYSNSNHQIGDTKISGASGSYEQIKNGNYYYRLFYADKKTFQNNISSVKVIASKSSITETFNLLTNTFVQRSSKQNNGYSTYSQTLPFSNGNGWTRSGYAAIQLHLNSDMASWTDTEGQNSTTYTLPTGSHTYTANVIVTISAE